jgi:hypothetical protein
MTTNVARLTIPDHLSPEDADLYVALYCERNRIDRDELRAVRAAVRAAQDAAARRTALHWWSDHRPVDYRSAEELHTA